MTVEQKWFMKREERSDKVYLVQLVQLGPNRFTVPVRYGRREPGIRESRQGNRFAWKTLERDSKYEVVLSEEDARTVYARVIRDRDKHGYQMFDNWEGLCVFNQIAYE